ncbi:proline-rich protein 18 [Ahaetulla prasina]|uniref:proline-rich protein 18 n=1 Tax=Ahaetulla prasina TaxID=499056 RepID=UPI002647F211|nr:proline-rich protein 18 [Ahaetulla prasina]
MSLPPIAPPPSAAPRLQARKQHQPSPPAAAPRKPMAVLATVPLAPGKPRKGRGVASERPAGFSNSWPSASLQKQLPRGKAAQGGRNAQQTEGGAAAAAAAAAALSAALSRSRGRSGPPAAGTRSCDSLCAAPGGRGEASLRFSLSLPPEAIRVLQRRSLEKQRPRGRVARFASPDASRCPLAGTSSPEGDLRALLQVSLLNERHRYDDVEYEEDEAAGDPGAFAADEGLVRKCTEWLRGVESAAARDRAGKMDTLPHLSTL